MVFTSYRWKIIKTQRCKIFLMIRGFSGSYIPGEDLSEVAHSIEQLHQPIDGGPKKLDGCDLV